MTHSTCLVVGVALFLFMLYLLLSSRFCSCAVATWNNTSHAFLLGYSDICRVTGCDINLHRLLLGLAFSAEPSDTKRPCVRGRSRHCCVKCVWVDRIDAFHRLAAVQPTIILGNKNDEGMEIDWTEVGKKSKDMVGNEMQSCQIWSCSVRHSVAWQESPLLLAKTHENDESGQPSAERAKLTPEHHLISRLPLFFSTDEIKAELEKQKWVLTQPTFEWTWWMITQPWMRVCACLCVFPPSSSCNASADARGKARPQAVWGKTRAATELL